MSEMYQFAYRRPENVGKAKTIVKLAELPGSKVMVQFVQEGGENNLHAHSRTDGFWMVLAGEARFYSDETELFATVGPMEGVCVPHTVKYWFESSGDVPLELLHIAVSIDPSHTEDDRINLTELTSAVKEAEIRG